MGVVHVPGALQEKLELMGMAINNVTFIIQQLSVNTI